jgi:hypothetical protein
MLTVAEKQPPSTIYILFCPECERTDRFMPFTGKGHFFRGVKCSGLPLQVEYVRKETLEMEEAK